MTSLVPDAFYWAKSAEHGDGVPTVVQVSTIFGGDREFWTLAVVGSDQHHAIDDFEILGSIDPPSESWHRLAAE